MNSSISIRPARISEVGRLAQLVAQQLPDMMASLARSGHLEKHLASLVPDESLQLVSIDSKLAGLGAVDLDEERILALYLDPTVATSQTPQDLLKALERHALDYGARRLRGLAHARAERFLKSLGYACQPHPDNSAQILIERDLECLADDGIRRIFTLCDQLGIPENYGSQRRLRVTPEAEGLEYIGMDILDRPQHMLPEAGRALRHMLAAAERSRIKLRMVSAYRSFDYQANLVRRKLEQGQPIEKILKVSAAPGYSEHHSGRAVDLTTLGVPLLDESFAHTAAYQWLLANAASFGFRESFPMHNRHDIIWEPWHWYFHR